MAQRSGHYCHRFWLTDTQIESRKTIMLKDKPARAAALRMGFAGWLFAGGLLSVSSPVAALVVADRMDMSVYETEMPTLRLTRSLASAFPADDNDGQRTKERPDSAISPTSGEEVPAKSRLKWAGYNKSMVIQSKTQDNAQESYLLAINRTRIKATYLLTPSVEMHVENDIEIRAGNYLDTQEFESNKHMPRQQYWNLQRVLADNRRYYVTDSLFRAHLKWSHDDTDVKIGRQRIPLGTGRIWSTLDMLNPINPLQIERDEYVGVDAVLVEQKLGTLSQFLATYAPDPARQDDRWVMRYRTNQNTSDIAVTLARYWRDNLIGTDVATQIGDAGLRGELTYTSPAQGSAYLKALVGIDYAFPNTFEVSFEAYYSGQSEQDRQQTFAENPQRLQLQPQGSRYGGVRLGYEFTPLWKGKLYFLNNLADRSRFVSPILTYMLSDNINLESGAQFFFGSTESEYGRGKSLYYAQLQCFF